MTEMTIEQATAIGLALGRVTSLEKSLRSEREALAALATKEGYVPSEEMGRVLTSIATLEGRLEVALTVQDATEGGASKEEIEKSVMSRVLNGPRDTWSGRGNDLRRARYEGVLEEAQRLGRRF